LESDNDSHEELSDPEMIFERELDDINTYLMLHEMRKRFKYKLDYDIGDYDMYNVNVLRARET